MYDMISCMSGAIDLVSPALSDHNRRVAAIACFLMDELGRSEDEIKKIIIAGSLHDIGALSLKERLSLLSFEVNNVQKHAELGYRHIKSFTPLSYIAPLIRYHHYSIAELDDAGIDDETAFMSNILHLADRISILIKNDAEILSQTKFITEIVSAAAGKMFYGETVDAYVSASRKEAFWLTVTGRHVGRYLKSRMKGWKAYLDLDHLEEFAKLFGRVIDFRSSFTAVHSSRVSVISSALSSYAGLPPEECRVVGIAGMLHDLGKLAVPTEILDKAAELSPAEWDIMRKHSFHTYELLSAIEGFESINRMASSHHERLDGGGYPFRLTGSQLTKGERIIAVADIYTALTEDRPYRKGMEADQVVGILNSLAEKNALDRTIVDIISSNTGHFDRLRIEAEARVADEYRSFIKGIDWN